MSDPLEVLRRALDEAAQEGGTRAFWWRDDDAVDTGPRLEALLSLAARHAAPVALAVVPARASERLLRRCEGEGAAILQHGVSHTDHERAGKKAELGAARGVEAIVADCLAARARLEGSPAFLPVMVPPWNRMRADLAAPLAAAGYRGLSLFAGQPHHTPLRRVDAHVDPVNWRGDRSLAPPERLAGMLRDALSMPGPVGLLTHHAVHTAAVDAFVERVVALVADHPGGAWLDAADVFRGRVA